MAVQLTIPYETLVTLVDQLPEEQKAELLRKLLQNLKPAELSAEDKVRLLKAIQSNTPLAEGAEFSDRREDWYGDDGR